VSATEVVGHKQRLDGGACAAQQNSRTEPGKLLTCLGLVGEVIGTKLIVCVKS